MPAELVRTGMGGGETIIGGFGGICSRIWRVAEWPTLWSQSLIIHSLKRAAYNSARAAELSASSFKQNRAESHF